MRAHEHGNEFDDGAAAEARRETPWHQETLPKLYGAAVAGRPDVVGTGGVGALQRAVGNQAVGAMLQRDADRPGEEESGLTGGGRSSVHDVVGSGGGQALDTDTRSDMEARLGADFSDVRVHTDSRAHDSAKEVGAHAYTVGNDVVFQRDAYAPGSDEGRTMLAHELTHVIQQRSGPVEGTEAPGGIRVSDPSDRYEREAVANAERAMAEPVPSSPAGAEAAAPVAAPAPATSAAVQRTEEDEGEDEEPADVQGAFVQRAAEEEEEEEATGDAP
ncbi:eCIS core domain-containing protein [Streptomyces xiamenensis]